MDIDKNKESLGINTIKTNRVHSSEVYRFLKCYAGKKINILVDDSGLLKLVCDTSNTEITILDVAETFIDITWSIEDVKSLRPDLTASECMEVLERVQARHDASIGVTYDSVKIDAEILFEKPNPPEIMGKFVCNNVIELINSLGKCSGLHSICNSDLILNGDNLNCSVELVQVIEARQLYHHWYGGDVCKITLSMNDRKITACIKANGDMRGWLYNSTKGELCNIKDKSNCGKFYEMVRYIPDDELLDKLLLNENEQGLTLKLDSCNWWELLIDTPNEDSIVLDSYSLSEALVEAVANMYKILKREDEKDK